MVHVYVNVACDISYNFYKFYCICILQHFERGSRKSLKAVQDKLYCQNSVEILKQIFINYAMWKRDKCIVEVDLIIDEFVATNLFIKFTKILKIYEKK